MISVVNHIPHALTSLRTALTDPNPWSFDAPGTSSLPLVTDVIETVSMHADGYVVFVVGGVANGVAFLETDIDPIAAWLRAIVAAGRGAVIPLWWFVGSPIFTTLSKQAQAIVDSEVMREGGHG